MAVADEVGTDVPIREGEYGERVATVEPGGIEYIPDSERHGKPKAEACLPRRFAWT